MPCRVATIPGAVPVRTRNGRGEEMPRCSCQHEKVVSPLHGDAGKLRNVCLTGWLRYRIPRGMPRVDGTSVPDDSGERVGDYG